MDRPTKTSELGADPSSLSRAEQLGALKKVNEAGTSFEPLPLMPAAANTPGGGQARVRERRRGPRLKCEGSVAFRTEGIDMQTWATFTDISIGGCYVELAATLPIRTPVNMVLEVKGVRVSQSGKNSHWKRYCGDSRAILDSPTSFPRLHLRRFPLRS